MKRLVTIALSLGLLFGVVLAVPATVLADAVVFGNNPDTCGAAGGSAGCSVKAGNPLTGGNGVLNNAINILTLVGGAIGVIFVAVGGIRIVFANGDSAKVQSGRDTVIYALVGLIVLVIARAIVGFAIGRL